MSILLSFVFQCVNLQQLNSPFIFRIVVVACSIDFIFSLCSTIVATAGHLFILVPSNSTTAKLRESWILLSWSARQEPQVYFTNWCSFDSIVLYFSLKILNLLNAYAEMWILYFPTAHSVLSTVRIRSSMVTASVAMGVIRPLSTCMKEMNGYTAVIRPLQVWQCEWSDHCPYIMLACLDREWVQKHCYM